MFTPLTLAQSAALTRQVTGAMVARSWQVKQDRRTAVKSAVTSILWGQICGYDVKFYIVSSCSEKCFRFDFLQRWRTHRSRWEKMRP